MHHIKSFTVYKWARQIVTDRQRLWKKFDTCNYSHFLVLSTRTCSRVIRDRQWAARHRSELDRIISQQSVCFVFSKTDPHHHDFEAVWRFATMQYDLMQ